MKRLDLAELFELAYSEDPNLFEDRWSDLIKDMGPGELKKTVAKVQDSARFKLLDYEPTGDVEPEDIEASPFWAGLEIKGLTAAQKKAMEKRFKELTRRGVDIDAATVAAILARTKITGGSTPDRATIVLKGTGKKARNEANILAIAMGVANANLTIGTSDVQIDIPKANVPIYRLMKKAHGIKEALSEGMLR